jgi:CRISPR-associated protein Cmr4
MNAIILKLECLTNLHVGNGESNYNIIDNEVEKDPVTGYPTINSSGVKGALRAFCSKQEDCKGKCNEWFGAEGQESKEGTLKILAANMLAKPARATKGNSAYYLVATQEMRDTYDRLKNSLQFKGKQATGESVKEVATEAAEGIDLKKSYEFDGKTIYEISDAEFRKISLPVIARNHLEDGISTNLWYEEVVPHESIFYVPVLSDASLDEFKKAVNGKVIQFGGNASVGCGLCKVTVGEE